MDNQEIKVIVNPGTENELTLKFDNDNWTPDNYYNLIKLFKEIFPNRKDISIKNLIAFLHNHSL